MNIFGIVILILCPQSFLAEDDLYSRLALLEVKVSSLLKTDAEQTKTKRLQEVKLQEQSAEIKELSAEIEEQSEEIKKLKRIIQDIQTRDRVTPVVPKHNSLTRQHRILSHHTGDQNSTKTLVAQEIDRSSRTINENVANNVPRTTRRGIVASPVAFTAVKIINQDNIGVDQNIKFESVVLNDGGGFHANAGIFIAPVSGYYLFTTSFLHPAGQNDIRIGLMHNGRLIAMVQAYTTWDQSAITLVLKIAAGDDVWLENKEIGSQRVFGEYYSSFSGVLLHQL